MSEVTASGTASTTTGAADDDTYPALLLAIKAHFQESTQGEWVPLFTTDVPPLYPRFLEALPAELRPSYACSACRRFTERFGGLVRIGKDGKRTPVLWPAVVPEPFAAPIRELAEAVAGAEITGVFLTADAQWGTATAGGWDHFAVTASAACLCKPSVLSTPGQLAAAKREDRATLLRGLEEFPLELVRNALALLTNDSLFRSEKCIEVARWLKELHEQRRTAKNVRVRDALTWLAVADAPPGFCNVRSTMIGTLLEDLAAKLPFAQLKARFDAKMHPLQYQRPTAAPSAGNIAQAEKIIATMKAAGSLDRRFARLADLRPLWQPSRAGEVARPKGVFAHLKPKAEAHAPVEAPAVTITWEKFARTVLPSATGIEYLVPSSKQSYLAMVTAQHPEAPAIVQWDFAEERNPVTYYVYVGGSPPAQWNLKPDVYHPVSAVTLQPSAWSSRGSFAHQGQHAIFLLEGARDTGYRSGAGFFPEFLKSELHGIRATLEAYAKSAVVAGKDEAEACGICLSKGATWNLTFRVTTTDDQRITYRLDRWD